VLRQSALNTPMFRSLLDSGYAGDGKSFRSDLLRVEQKVKLYSYTQVTRARALSAVTNI